MRNKWFESVAEAERRAQKRLPRSVFMAIRAGSESGATLIENVAAFRELGFAPHVAGLSPVRHMATTVMEQQISLPVVLSPTGVQAVHPEGEMAVARAASAQGTAIAVSSFASTPLEDVVAANPKAFFQIYWSGSREQIMQRVERAKNAGVVGLIVTLDWSFAHARDWGSPRIPERLDLRTMLRMAPEGLSRPQWLLRWLKAGQLPDLTVPNMSPQGQPARGFFSAYREWMQTQPPTWDDLRWLREQWEGPFMLKGVIRVDDARRAGDIGMTAISVSNHGGNNLDGTPAAIRALPAIAAAVGDQMEVLLDGGIRRGGDVVKAVSLGARAVMIGRPYLWGLAASGQAGVENVLDILKIGIDSTLLALGRSSIAELGPDDVLVPQGFVCSLGDEERSPGQRVRTLGDLTTQEVTGGLLIVPVGSTEQHGPHLPVSTDTTIATAIAIRLAEAVQSAVVAPPIAYGSSGEHQAFAGTVSIGQEALELLLLELGRSASASFERIVFVSTHGGNVEPVSRATERLRAESRDVVAWYPDWAGDAHAGRIETSLMLALDPKHVDQTRAEMGNTAPLTDLMSDLEAKGVRAVSPNGVLGDPTAASAEEGRQLLSSALERLLAAIEWD